ncbi:hypothetical protein [Eisenibacter elegans]|jgi:hypothetical protein|uniref:hypothetical protein n=1 Tax=Eisenibacter elegans TaxID=997 RepID=UPI000428DC6F|nr:hypothetical protein [Eisenibacter elegans]
MAYKYFWIAAVLSISLGLLCYWPAISKTDSRHIVGATSGLADEDKRCLNLKMKPIHLGYYVRPGFQYKQRELENLRLPSKSSTNGKIIEALRYENISDAVEARYCLPPKIILAIMIQETRGQDCLPNVTGNYSWGDGGFGLCHIQGVVGREYGLNTVCNDHCGEADSKFKCYKHARELGMAMTYLDQCDMRKSIYRDDRLHPILNLDAVGRILARKGGDPKEMVFHFRGGTWQQKNGYWKNVEQFRLQLISSWRRENIKQEFNELNKHMLIDGEYVDNPYEAYIAYHQAQNINYGLWNYVAMGVCENCCQR